MVIDKNIQAQGFLRRKRVGVYSLGVRMELASTFSPSMASFKLSLKLCAEIIYLIPEEIDFHIDGGILILKP